MTGLRRFVENLLRQRRGQAVAVDPEYDGELRTAILLRSARPGADAPTEEFVSQLHQRLTTELADPDRPRVTRRRRIVQVASVAAASAAVGAGLNQVLTPQPLRHQPADAAGHGGWQTVAAGTDLPEGGVLAFDLGVLNGFVRRSGGQVLAVSGVCTHLGCRLALNRPDRSLDCPCHNAAFALDGTVLHHQLPIPLTNLPSFAARENNGQIQVFVPHV